MTLFDQKYEKYQITIKLYLKFIYFSEQGSLLNNQIPYTFVQAILSQMSQYFVDS
jgi:hypothetical protein